MQCYVCNVMYDAMCCVMQCYVMICSRLVMHYSWSPWYAVTCSFHTHTVLALVSGIVCGVSLVASHLGCAGQWAPAPVCVGAGAALWAPLVGERPRRQHVGPPAADDSRRARAARRDAAPATAPLRRTAAAAEPAAGATLSAGRRRRPRQQRSVPSGPV